MTERMLLGNSSPVWLFVDASLRGDGGFSGTPQFVVSSGPDIYNRGTHARGKLQKEQKPMIHV